MIRFADAKDENGTSLQSFAELLAEKAKQAGYLTVMVFAHKEAGAIHTVSNVDGSLSQILIALGRRMAANIPNDFELGPELVTAPEKTRPN
jgi:hypothetical protein